MKLQPICTREGYKARFVAKGYIQTYGVDYHKTFSLVAKMNSIRILISDVANQGFPLLQLDVKKMSSYMEALKRKFI